MATTTYIILPFVASKRGGQLCACPRQSVKDQAKAIQTAERMAPRYAGVAVLEERSDPEQDIYAEPRVIRMIGRVPDEMAGLLAA